MNFQYVLLYKFIHEKQKKFVDQRSCPLFEEMQVAVKTVREGDFPGSSLVKILRFNCNGHGFHPWLGN